MVAIIEPIIRILPSLAVEESHPDRTPRLCQHTLVCLLCRGERLGHCRHYHPGQYRRGIIYGFYVLLQFLQTYRTNRVDSAGTGWSSSIIAGVNLLRRGSIVTSAGGPLIATAWSPPPQSTHIIIETVERENYLLFQLLLPCTCRLQFHQGTHMLVCCCQNTWVSLLHSGTP